MLSSPGDFRWLRDQLHQTQSCVYYKEHSFGHLGFLFPHTIKYFYELLQLIKHYDPSYKLLAVKHQLQHDKCEFELEVAQCIVDEILEMMKSPLPHLQKQLEEKMVIQENYIKPTTQQNPYLNIDKISADVKKTGKDVFGSISKLF